MAGNDLPIERLSFVWLSELDGAALEAVRRLLNAVLELDDVVGFTQPIASIEHPYLTSLASAVKNAELAVHACFLDGELAAMVHIKRDAQPNCRHRAELSKCMIHPHYRNRGILERGLIHVLEHCRRSEVEVLTLDVRAGGRAEAIWRRLGFQEYGMLPDYARLAGKSLPGYFLWASVAELASHARREA